MNRLRAYALDILSAPVASDVGQWVPPTSLEWMPSGEHEIYAASSDSNSGPFKVTCGPDDAARLDAQLQEMLKKANAGEASRPFIDFDHTGTKAAAIPVRFFWADGIRLDVEWTEEGADSLRGRVYSYFSPEFFLGEDGHPSALPDVGPIGALVNTPAFQSIERLAATHKNPEAEASKTTQNKMKELLKVLVEAKLLTSEELPDTEAASSVKAALDAGAQKLSASEQQINALTAERDALLAEKEANSLKAAEAIVSEAVTAGRLKDDKDLRAKWVAALHKDPGSKAMLDAIEPVKAKAGHSIGTQQKTGSESLTGLARVTAAFNAAKRN